MQQRGRAQLNHGLCQTYVHVKWYVAVFLKYVDIPDCFNLYMMPVVKPKQACMYWDD